MSVSPNILLAFHAELRILSERHTERNQNMSTAATQLADRLASAAVIALDTLTNILKAPEKPDAATREARLAASQILRLAVGLLRRPAPAERTTQKELSASATPSASARDVRLLATETLRLAEEAAAQFIHSPASAPAPPANAPPTPARPSARPPSDDASNQPISPPPPDPLSHPRFQKHQDRLRQLLARTGTS
jgi:hypothetical protein